MKDKIRLTLTLLSIVAYIYWLFYMAINNMDIAKAVLPSIGIVLVVISYDNSKGV